MLSLSLSLLESKSKIKIFYCGCAVAVPNRSCSAVTVEAVKTLRESLHTNQNTHSIKTKRPTKSRLSSSSLLLSIVTRLSLRLHALLSQCHSHSQTHTHTAAVHLHVCVAPVLDPHTKAVREQKEERESAPERAYTRT